MVRWYFKLGNLDKKVKRKAILLIDDVGCITNRFFYMRTLSLISFVAEMSTINNNVKKV